MEGRLLYLIRTSVPTANTNPWQITNNLSTLGFPLSHTQIDEGRKWFPLSEADRLGDPFASQVEDCRMGVSRTTRRIIKAGWTEWCVHSINLEVPDYPSPQYAESAKVIVVRYNNDYDFGIPTLATEARRLEMTLESDKLWRVTNNHLGIPGVPIASGSVPTSPLSILNSYFLRQHGPPNRVSVLEYLPTLMADHQFESTPGLSDWRVHCVQDDGYTSGKGSETHWVEGAIVYIVRYQIRSQK
ncbi:hypothetical protein N7G274_002640 [Stereocaulon virgatum]|uniref:Uncharacterized protein n=1 Tax=Stereocaulon virgatum TaxID=373712 RepID=A0ABR4AI67_9LECA